MKTLARKYIYWKNVISLRKPTTSQIANYLVELSYKLKSDRFFGNPRSLFIEPINSCNLRCAICPTGRRVLNRSKAMMSFDDFKIIVGKLRKTLLRLTFAGYGEPFLNPNTVDMLIYAKEIGTWVEVYTNLLLLNESSIKLLVDHRIDKLIVSIDAAIENVYRRHKRAGSFTETVKIP